MATRDRTALLTAAFVVTLSACSTLRTTTDYDPTADFSKYSTFALRDVHSQGDDLLNRRIQGALESVLSEKRLRRADADPDLWVVAHWRLRHETQISTYNSGWGYGWRWRGGMGVSRSTVEKIPVGMLMVDLVDAKAKELVWRGTASNTLKADAKPEEREKAIREAVSKMFQAFPPPARSSK